MKRLLLPMTAIAISGIAFAQAPNASVPAQAPRRLAPNAVLAFDTDKDGMVSRGEYMADSTARFNRMDANHDGRLTIEERNSERTPASGMTPMKVPAPGTPPVKQGAVDADGDGLVSRDEYFFNIGTIWAGYDANRDDRITADEIAPPLGASSPR